MSDAAPTPADLAAPNVRRIIRANRLLAELGHADILDALNELVERRAAATREPPAPAVPKLRETMNQAFDRRNENQCMSYGAFAEGWRCALDALDSSSQTVATQRQPIVPEGPVAWVDQETFDCLTKNIHGAIAYHRAIAVGAPDRFQGRTIPLYAAPVASDRDSMVPAAQPAEPKERKPLTEDGDA